MNDFPLNLVDLTPQEFSFELRAFEGKKLTLNKWSLLARGWASEKFGEEKLNEAFSKIQIQVIAELAWFLLKDADKAEFFHNSREEFLGNICGPKDELAVIDALLGCVGMGEPEKKKLEKYAKKLVNEGSNTNPNVRRPNSKK